MDLFKHQAVFERPSHEIPPGRSPIARSYDYRPPGLDPLGPGHFRPAERRLGPVLYLACTSTATAKCIDP